MNKYRIHLLALPNAQTTRAYSLDGFSQMTIRFARMMKRLGHVVYLYASEENEAPCDELITVILKEEQETLLQATVNPNTGKREPTPYQFAYIEEWSPLWQLANARMVKEIGKRKLLQKYDVNGRVLTQCRDLICSIGGGSQRPVADGHPDMMFVEYSIGYPASFSPYRVFESEAWRHTTYGLQNIQDGRFFDDVIPCAYDPDEFPFEERKEPFALYVGRLTARKGVHIAAQAAKAAGIPLKIVGNGSKQFIPERTEYLGELDWRERNGWMAQAACVLCPTIYIEPFNQVAVEAQLCGTPVVATPWGGFTETIEEGVSGFRCHTLGEFVAGIRASMSLDPRRIRERAIRLYSLDVVALRYQAYFDRLSLLWGKGWDSMDIETQEQEHPPGDPSDPMQIPIEGETPTTEPMTNQQPEELETL